MLLIYYNYKADIFFFKLNVFVCNSNLIKLLLLYSEVILSYIWHPNNYFNLYAHSIAGSIVCIIINVKLYPLYIYVDGAVTSSIDL